MAKSKRKGFMRPCAFCVGHRLHVFQTAIDPITGQVTRKAECSACQTVTSVPPNEQPGLCCQRCGDCRLPIVFTRHQAPGQTRRTRRCRHCGKTLRTMERAW